MASPSSSSSSSSTKSGPSRTCLCSPTTHPGSFRCSLHRNPRRKASSPARSEAKASGLKEKSVRSLLLLMIIGPSRHNLCRRRNFKPKPSRFCVADGGDHGVTVS